MKTLMLPTCGILGCTLILSAQDQNASQRPESKATAQAPTETQQPDLTPPHIKPHVGPRWEALPPSVQKTVEEHAGGEPVADIDKQTQGDEVVYEFEFTEKGGNRKIHVAEDGTLIKEAAGAQPSRTNETKRTNAP